MSYDKSAFGVQLAFNRTSSFIQPPAPGTATGAFRLQPTPRVAAPAARERVWSCRRWQALPLDPRPPHTVGTLGHSAQSQSHTSYSHLRQTHDSQSVTPDARGAQGEAEGWGGGDGERRSVAGRQAT